MPSSFSSLIQELQRVHEEEIRVERSKVNMLSQQLDAVLVQIKNAGYISSSLEAQLTESTRLVAHTYSDCLPHRFSMPLPKTPPRPEATEVPVEFTLPTPRPKGNAKHLNVIGHGTELKDLRDGFTQPMPRQPSQSQETIAPTSSSEAPLTESTKTMSRSVVCDEEEVSTDNMNVTFSKDNMNMTFSKDNMNTTTASPESGVVVKSQERPTSNGLHHQIAKEMNQTKSDSYNSSLISKLESEVRVSKLADAASYREVKTLREKVARCLKHPQAEACIAVLIFMNSLVMCFQLHYDGLQIGYELDYERMNSEAKDVWPYAREILQMLEYFFGMLFTIEVFVKMATFLRAFFKDVFNYIDLLTALCFLTELSAGGFPINPNTLRLFRLVRLGRLVKLIRTVEACSALYLIVRSITGSLKVLGWAFVLFIVVQMVAALLVAQVLQATFFKDRSAHSLASQRQMFEYFGTFTRSMFSMFEMTLANWPPVARLLSEHHSEWWMLFCVVHKLTVGFAVVNVITGVFMKETFRVADTDDCLMTRAKIRAMKRHVKKMRRLFYALDASADGQIDIEEFERILLTHPEVRTWLSSMDLDMDHWTLESVFWLIDKDKDGYITMEELCEGIAYLRGPAKSIDVVSWFHRLRCELGLFLRPGQQQSNSSLGEVVTPINTTHNWDEVPSGVKSGQLDLKARKGIVRPEVDPVTSAQLVPVSPSSADNLFK